MSVVVVTTTVVVTPERNVTTVLKFMTTVVPVRSGSLS